MVGWIPSVCRMKARKQHQEELLEQRQQVESVIRAEMNTVMKKKLAEVSSSAHNEHHTSLSAAMREYEAVQARRDAEHKVAIWAPPSARSKNVLKWQS